MLPALLALAPIAAKVVGGLLNSSKGNENAQASNQQQTTQQGSIFDKQVTIKLGDVKQLAAEIEAAERSGKLNLSA